MSGLNILLVGNRPSSRAQASTVVDYLDAFKNCERHRYFEVAMLGNFPEFIPLSIFDVVLVHYTLSVGPLKNHYLGKNFVKKLKEYSGVKAVFIQDEYRDIKVFQDNIRDIGFDIVFSCVPKKFVNKVYPKSKLPNLKVVSVLTGYVPERLLKQVAIPLEEREIDVGYRTRQMPFWLGELAYEKVFIGSEFSRRSKLKGLRVDISSREEDRLYGSDWDNFLGNCKAVLGTESGASVGDFDGSIESRGRRYLQQNPHANFSEFSNKILKEVEGNLPLNQISPRCFEAMALRTPMILFEGNYSGIISANRHYISLKKDFSNFDEVCDKLRDLDFLEELALNAYREVATSPRNQYSALLTTVANELEEACEKRSVRTVPAYSIETRFFLGKHLSLLYKFRKSIIKFNQSVFLGNRAGRKFIFGTYNALPLSLQKKIRPLAVWLGK